MKVPVIELWLKDTPHYALIDTGSELTLFDNNFNIQDKGKTKYNLSLTGAGGTCKHSAYKSQLVFTTGNKEQIAIDGLYILDNSVFKDTNSLYGDGLCIDIVIGSDTLRKLGAKVDYKNNVLVINDIPCQ